MARYLDNLVCRCSDEKFGQDAVDWAVMTNRFALTGDLDEDVLRMMGPPGQPERGEYPRIIDAYQAEVRSQTDELVESYAPLLEQIFAPMQKAA